MKAIVITKQGPPDLLQLQAVEKPVPKDNEVLVKVHAATVTIGDVILRKLKFPMTLLFRLFGAPAKKIPGHEFAGEIEAVGQNVSRFKVGDQIFGTTTGLKVGANAEYVCLPEERPKGVLALKPANLTYEEAAAVPVGGMTALYILKQGNIQPGEKVLINGASGSVGSFAVQIAKHLGAEVTGVTSTANVEMAKSLGADKVIDYKQEDFTRNGERYDVIFDAVGKTSASKCEDVLKENGRFLTVQSSTTEEMENFMYLREMIEAGALRPYIDRTFPLAETAAAHRYVETGRKKGNVVITVVENQQGLDAAYKQMAQDEEHEAEALEWAEGTVGDVGDELNPSSF